MILRPWDIKTDIDYIDSKEKTFIEEYGAENCLLKDRLEKLQDSLVIFVIEEDKKQIGYFICAFFEKAKRKKEVCHIVTMYINPEYRNQGLCTKYLQELMGKLKDLFVIDMFTADTLQTNEQSINVFKKLKFSTRIYLKDNIPWVAFEK